MPYNSEKYFGAIEPLFEDPQDAKSCTLYMTGFEILEFSQVCEKKDTEDPVIPVSLIRHSPERDTKYFAVPKSLVPFFPKKVWPAIAFCGMGDWPRKDFRPFKHLGVKVFNGEEFIPLEEWI